MNNMLLRTITGTIYIGLILGAFGFNPFYGQLLLTAFFALCLFEGTVMLDIKSHYLAGLAVGLSYFALSIYCDISSWREIWMPSAAILLFLYSMATRLTIKNLGKLIFIIAALLIPFNIGASFIGGTDGLVKAQLIIFVFISLWTNDTFAYLSGRALGRTKLAPNISPGKTWEGFIGGLIAALGIGFGIDAVFETNYWWYFAPLMGLAGTFGDLFESKMKRESSIKDSSNLIPGHGGFLDRLDSFIFAMPVFYICYTLLL